MREPHKLFWFVHAKDGTEDVAVAVAADTERSARRQARKRLGPDAMIESITPVTYAHAWVMNLLWSPKQREAVA